MMINNKYNKWFYVRVDNRRMENESLLTYLCFLEFATSLDENRREAPANFDIYKSSSKLNVRINNKSQITSSLDDLGNKPKFLESCKNLEDHFIAKLKALMSDNTTDDDTLKSDLDAILGVSKLRTFQNFYTLWYILLNISIEAAKQHKIALRQEINTLIKEMRTQTDVQLFKTKVQKIQDRYK